jgi:hypothetical protein
MLRTRNLTLTGTPSLLTITDEVSSPRTISIQNTDASEYVYIGGPDVSDSSYGIKLDPSGIASLDLGAYDEIYAVGAGTVAVLLLDR